MKTGFKTLAAIAVVAASISIAPVTASAIMGGDGLPPAGRHFKKMATELGLSSQQKQEVKDIFAKSRSQAEPLMKQIKTERHALRELVQADVIDEAAIRAQSAKVAAVEADLAVQRAHVAQQIRAILTPEQVQKFKAIQAKRDSRMDEMPNRGSKRFKQDN